MSVFKNLKSVMDTVILWENSLKDFYDVAEFAMRDVKSKETIRLLRSKHINNLRMLKDIDIESFGKCEWVRYLPERRSGELIPVGKLTRDSDPLEICRCISEYEDKVKKFYLLICEVIVERNHKELFVSLAAFKDLQLLEIKRLTESIEYI